jgi:hypothetical protein
MQVFDVVKQMIPQKMLNVIILVDFDTRISVFVLSSRSKHSESQMSHKS